MQVLKNIEREEGQGLVEYALILVLVAVIVIIILTILGSAVTLVFARVVGGLNGDVIDDGAVYLTSASTVSGSGTCSGTLSDFKYVVLDSNGDMIKDGTANAQLWVNGSFVGNVSGTADGTGIATSSSSIGVNGTCPLKITMRTN